MPSRLLLAGLIAFVAAPLAPGATAQTLDLGPVLSGLRGTVGALGPGSTVEDRTTALLGVANGLIGPAGALAGIETAVDAQADLLSHQTGDLVSVRADLDLLRTSLGLNTTVLSSVDRSVTRYETRVEAQDARLASHDGRISNVEQATAALSQRVSGVEEKAAIATEGVAMALALRSPTVAEDKTFAVSGGWGTFEGRNAFAVSGAIRANSLLQFDGGVAVGDRSAGVGGRAGATLSW